MSKKNTNGGLFGSILIGFVAIIAVCILVCCVSQLLPKLLEYKQSDDAFQEMQDKGITEYDPADLAVVGTDETSADVDVSDALKIDWDAYSGTEIVGWFQLDDISYPIMQHSDNEYYLHHLPDGSWNSGGSLFLLNHNNPLLTDQSNFIYGHNMANGSMFSKLKNYTSNDFKDYTFSIYLPDGTRHVYQFFAVATVYQESKAYTWSFESDETFMDWQNWMLNESMIDTSLNPSETAKYMTLSTCNGGSGTNHRLVVCGQEVRIDTLQEPASWYQSYLQKYSETNDAKHEKADSIYNQLLAIQQSNLDVLLKQRNGL